MTALRFILSWILYSAGHTCWFLFEHRIPAYRAYQKLMDWSSSVQGHGNNGPWGMVSMEKAPDD